MKHLFQIRKLILTIGLLVFLIIKSVGQPLYFYQNSSQTIGSRILPGTSDNVIYSNYIISYSSNVYSLTGVSFNLQSNFTSNELANSNSFKLWISDKEKYDGTATALASVNLPIVTTTGNLNFTFPLITNPGYYYNNSYKYKYLYVTVDVSNTASLGKNILILKPNSATGAGMSFSDQTGTINSSTITLTTGSINISGGNSIYNTISKNAKGVSIGNIYVNNQISKNTFNSLTITTLGTYTLNDLAPGGFSLVYKDNNLNKTTVIATVSGVVTGSQIVFTPISAEVANIQIGNGYLNIIANTANTTTTGKTIGISQVNSTNLIFNNATIIGSVQSTNHLIGSPTYNLSMNNNSGPNLKIGTDKNVIQSFYLTSYDGSYNLNSLTLSIAGTYLSSDIKNSTFSLYKSSNSNFYPQYPDYQTLISQTNSSSVGNGESITFQNLDLAFEIYEGNYYYITVDISTSAGLGRTIVSPTMAGNIAFGMSAGTVASNLSTGGVKTIRNPTIAASDWPISPTSYGINTNNNVIYAFKLKPSDLNSDLLNITLTTGGTYLASDISNYSLSYNTSGDYYNDPNLYSLANNYSSISSGGKLAFDFNSTLSITEEYYFFVTIGISNNAQKGNKISITGNIPSAISAPGVNTTGNISKGSDFTIGSPTVVVTQQTLPNSNVSIGSFHNPVYKVKIDVSGTNARISNLSTKTSGTYQTQDMGSPAYYGWYSSDDIFDPNTDEQISNAYSNNSTGSGENLNFNNYSKTFPLGTSYVFITTNINSNAKPERTIQIASITGIQFSGTTTTSNLSSGAVQTIKQAIVSIANGGNNDEIITTNKENAILTTLINVQNSEVYLSRLTVSISGTYTNNDINYFNLYSSNSPVYNSNNAISLGGFSSQSTGNGESKTINLNSKLPIGQNYIHMVGSVRYNAVDGRTIKIGQITSTSFGFIGSTATGTSFAGGLKTIYNLATVASLNIPSSFLTKGKTDNPIYGFSINTLGYYTTFNSLTVTLTGSFNRTVLGTNFKLAYSSSSVLGNSFSTLKTTTLSSNNTLTFNNINQTTYYYNGPYYYFILTDVNNVPTLGGTVQATVNDISSINMSFGTVTGTLGNGNVHTLIDNPSIQLGSEQQIPAKTVSPGIYDTKLYSFKLTSNAAFRLNSLIATTSGTYTYSDFSYGQLYSSKNADLSNPSYAGYFYAYKSISSATGENISIYSNRNFSSGDTYFYLTVDAQNSATIGRTIAIQGINPAQININNATATGSVLLQGNQVTIATPTVQVSTPTVATGSISKNTENVIYTTAFSVSGAPVTLNNLTLTVDGNFSSSDIDYFSLYISTSPSFKSNDYYYNNGYSNNSGNLPVIVDISLGAQMPIGNSYAYLVATVKSGAQNGSTISVRALDITKGITLGYGTASGTSLPGGTQTIGSGMVSIGTYSQLAGDIQQNTKNQIVHIIPMTVSGASIYLQSLYISKTGTLVTSDVESNGFKLWINNQPTLTGAESIATTTYSSSSNYYFYPYKTLAVGTSYLLLTMDLTSTATIGNTIKFSTFPSSNMTLGSGVKTGLATQGATFTVIAQVPPQQVGILDNSIAENINIYPNPTDYILNIDISNNSGYESLKLVNLIGTIERTLNLELGNNQLDVQGLASGVYFLQLRKNGQTLVKRVVIR